MNPATPIQARMITRSELLAGGMAPDWIMWMPGGTHKIYCSKGGKRVTLQVTVTPETARVVQEQLVVTRQVGKQRPFFDFNHDEASASAWPLEFAWRDEPAGVWAHVEWSQAGREAIAGRTYRAFSPAFFVESESGTKPTNVTGAPFVMGGLVNDPAFRDIEPIWTSRARGESTNQDNNMADRAELELAAQQARVTELEQQIAELQAAASADDSKEVILAKNNEIAELQRKLDEQQNLVKARAKRDAEACVRAAVNRGAIPAADSTLQAHWVGLIETDPKNADLLNAQKGTVALQAQRLTHSRVELIAEDTNDALRAYNTEKDPRKRGELYRKELDPILAKGERIPFDRLPSPFKAANTLGTLVGNIVSQRTLATLVSLRPLLKDVVTDFSDEQARLGQVVYTRAVGLPAVTDFGAAAEESVVTDYPVTMNAHKQAMFSFTAAEQNSTGRNLVKEHSTALAISIGNHLVGAVAALITDAFTSESVGAAGSKDFSAITTACKVLNTAGAPDYDRFAWVNADFAEALSNDEVLADFSDKANTSAYARWVNVKGFGAITEFPALPGNAIQLIGFAGQRNSLLLTTRTALDPSQIIGSGYAGTLQVVTDSVSGLSVINNMWVDQFTLAVNTRIILMYGVARGLIGAGHKFVTA